MKGHEFVAIFRKIFITNEHEENEENFEFLSCGSKATWPYELKQNSSYAYRSTLQRKTRVFAIRYSLGISLISSGIHKITAHLLTPTNRSLT